MGISWLDNTWHVGRSSWSSALPNNDITQEKTEQTDLLGTSGICHIVWPSCHKTLHLHNLTVTIRTWHGYLQCGVTCFGLESHWFLAQWQTDNLQAYTNGEGLQSCGCRFRSLSVLGGWPQEYSGFRMRFMVRCWKLWTIRDIMVLVDWQTKGEVSTLKKMGRKAFFGY